MRLGGRIRIALGIIICLLGCDRFLSFDEGRREREKGVG